ncbi:hypothetical protein Ahy_A06g029191 [Arachis hypogaea]|uniref:MULE transposase domain-containing protein n=1 Tax=Arachis hypogaea TaxID=3818 RepID=A0A445CST8_ARAHY|nr:hypothetical protein Ahy_A06g029191 [Arachis hypogaea]
MSKAGIQPSKTFQALTDEAGGRSNLNFVEKDVRNYLSGKLRIHGDDTDVQEMLDYFRKMKEQNPNFFYEICVYSDNSLKYVFWADARSRAAYKYFGDVVSFDTIYKLNKFEMPVAAFVGVNQQEKLVLFGCALLGNKETKFFEWVMQTFVKYKEQKDLECDAADNRGLILCVLNSPIEKQF